MYLTKLRFEMRVISCPLDYSNACRDVALLSLYKRFTPMSILSVLLAPMYVGRVDRS